METNQIEVKDEASAVPWSVMDTWLGVGLLVLLSLGMSALVFFGLQAQYLQSVGALLLESMYILPVVLILAWRGIAWRHLGFRTFPISVLALGFVLLVAGYIVILLHNALLYVLGVETQGEQIVDLFAQLAAPGWLFFTGAVVAPIVEEIFFRGFLFQGFRQKYGWQVGVLLSSVIFGVAHLDPASLIPTTVLGCVLAYMCHRSNSVFPGMLFHAAINSFSLCMVYVISKYPGLIPS